MKRIESHITVNGRPLCGIPFMVLREMHPALESERCGHRSLYAARKAAAKAKHWTVKAVAGRCPEVER